ncbi:hypothetical protein BpHYR1_019816 [Brachionus plicatilis]|uniref:RNA-directed DNA polymerase from mobile element jockey-like n=1 Tax=Brachionus plicatilis TaxID=10195 RepID=A0A3M7RXK0_BRAPC|nr:hypothetical protein BpHYR1_019816 [Brachionus plicatilis]
MTNLCLSIILLNLLFLELFEQNLIDILLGKVHTNTNGTCIRQCKETGKVFHSIPNGHPRSVTTNLKGSKDLFKRILNARYTLFTKNKEAVLGNKYNLNNLLMSKLSDKHYWAPVICRYNQIISYDHLPRSERHKISTEKVDRQLVRLAKKNRAFPSHILADIENCQMKEKNQIVMSQLSYNH